MNNRFFVHIFLIILTSLTSNCSGDGCQVQFLLQPKDIPTNIKTIMAVLKKPRMTETNELTFGATATQKLKVSEQDAGDCYGRYEVFVRETGRSVKWGLYVGKFDLPTGTTAATIEITHQQGKFIAKLVTGGATAPGPQSPPGVPGPAPHPEPPSPPVQVPVPPVQGPAAPPNLPTSTAGGPGQAPGNVPANPAPGNVPANPAPGNVPANPAPGNPAGGDAGGGGTKTQGTVKTNPIFKNAWPTNVIPYYFTTEQEAANNGGDNTELTEQHKKAFHSAVESVQSNSCVRFVEMSREEAKKQGTHVAVFCQPLPPGTLAGVMRHWPFQPGVKMEYSFNKHLPEEPFEKTRKTALHELMHVLGFLHEHARMDRDRYIVVNFANIQRSAHSQWQMTPKEENLVTQIGKPYECESITHYGQNGDWMSARSNYCDNKKMGESLDLTTYDTIALNMVYGCKNELEKNKQDHPAEFGKFTNPILPT